MDASCARDATEQDGDSAKAYNAKQVMQGPVMARNSVATRDWGGPLAWTQRFDVGVRLIVTVGSRESEESLKEVLSLLRLTLGPLFSGTFR